MSRSSPALVGKYQVIERLAVGGMAEVLKARVLGQHGFEKLVVIKRILPHLATDPHFVDMFFDEARLTAQLEHPNIVQVFELGTDSEFPYIAMQYVDGVDVLGLLQRCATTQIRLPAGVAAFIIRCVLDALDYAHHATDSAGRRLGVIHRDVSPGNILLSTRGDVKLTDFGIARAQEQRHKTNTGAIKGKYGYVSPEQIRGDEVDHRADLFSAGVVLAEMVMARRLFAADNDLDTLLMVRDAKVDRLYEHEQEFPRDLRDIVVRALQAHPDSRWPSAAAFRDELDEWLVHNGHASSRDVAEFVNRVLGAPEVQPLDDTGGDLREADRRPNHQRTPLPLIAPEEIIDDDDLTEATLEGDPQAAGSLRDNHPLALLHGLVKARATGLLVVRNASTVKTAFFQDGEPQFVQSNQPRERLAPFLLQENAVTHEALQLANASLSRFGKRLVDALVGTHALTPLQAYRLLAKQVSAKLIDVCTWAGGRYEWYPTSHNPFPTRPLHIDGFRVVGAGALGLDIREMETWFKDQAGKVGLALPVRPGELAAFGLGEAMERVHAMLDGRTPVLEIVGRARSSDARGNLMRLLFLLVQIQAARVA
jgi:serine/threonine protein kinase